ncbi:MAG: GspE/PulE family protein [Gammaproteobacteria bacterium]|nr:GspE/PulE family protein [Gammaproteobacteria bacterium]
MMQEKIIRSQGELRAVLSLQMSVPDRPMGEIIVEKHKLISRIQLNSLLQQQKGGVNKRLGVMLVDQGLLSQEQVYVALAAKFGIPYVRLDEFDIHSDVLRRIPEEVAFRYNIMPLVVLGRRLVVAMENPLDLGSIEALTFAINLKLEAVISPLRDIAVAQSKYYSRFDEHEALQDKELVPLPYHVTQTGSMHIIEARARKKPLVRLLNAIVLQGIVRGASDINIRPGKDGIKVYYRIDGQLQFARAMDKSLLLPLICRIKVLGSMDIAERRLPQDGHVSLMRGKRHIDLRVSVIPTVDGESIVIRILDKEVGVKQFPDLGLVKSQQQKLSTLISRQSGLFLVVGPTGSGKTTTLYALLNEIKKKNVHIVTIEDPVEYEMEGIEQVQVAASREIDFARVLRSVLRHDPDVIMVGEIRDNETAEIANKAALTGHFVLSTLHTHDCVSTVLRLIDMGLKPYLLAATLKGVMAQRLVRLNCEHCVGSVSVDAATRTVLHLAQHEPVLSGKGCNACNQSGFHGRTLISEVLMIDDVIAGLINTRAPHQQITESALKSGMVSMNDDLIRLVRAGKVSAEEALSYDV